MAHQSPHVAPLDKTRLCHLPCWHPSPPPSSSPFPNHLCHTNTPSCPSAALARDNASSVTSARSPAPDDSEGATRLCDITNPQVKGAKQLDPTEEDLSHVSWDSNRSGLMVILDRAQREPERESLPGLLRS